EQHFTQPPPRYTEATLVRDLEQKGIGRPSTYAPTLSVIQERDYVRKGAGRFFPTDLGEIVNGILTQHFPQIVDLGFTARMEEQLDEVAQGQQEWVSLLRDFYQPFEDMLHKASLDVDKVDMTQPAGETCPNCGRPMVIKLGRFGKFVACSGYPECKTTKPFSVRTGVACPQCGSDLVEKVTKRKRLFYGCSNYPQCKFATSYRPISVPCPECGKLLVSYRRGLAKCVVCGYQVARSELESVEAERE
ncbi:MAG: topoisomerase DNA-binding C4 zinc finger domain-containing protein, partial [Dehalococcoidia bacterium]|nr:topoisomerase DNA-binding C4 zinc finger domain-containing protein [Dehalococcoidia bacterium]